MRIRRTVGCHRNIAHNAIRKWYPRTLDLIENNNNNNWLDLSLVAVARAYESGIKGALHYNQSECSVLDVGGTVSSCNQFRYQVTRLWSVSWYHWNKVHSFFSLLHCFFGSTHCAKVDFRRHKYFKCISVISEPYCLLHSYLLLCLYNCFLSFSFSLPFCSIYFYSELRTTHQQNRTAHTYWCRAERLYFLILSFLIH